MGANWGSQGGEEPKLALGSQPIYLGAWSSSACSWRSRTPPSSCQGPWRPPRQGRPFSESTRSPLFFYLDQVMTLNKGWIGALAQRTTAKFHSKSTFTRQVGFMCYRFRIDLKPTKTGPRNLCCHPGSLYWPYVIGQLHYVKPTQVKMIVFNWC